MIVRLVFLRIHVILSSLFRPPAPGGIVSPYSLASNVRPDRLSIITPLVVLGRLQSSDQVDIFHRRSIADRLKRIDRPPRLTRLPRAIGSTRLASMATIPSMARKTRLPSTIRLSILNRRGRQTRTATPDRPTRMNRLTRPAKMPTLN